MKQKILVGVIALLFGMLGVGLVLVGLHLYQDHVNLHALIQIEAQRQQAAQKQAGPVMPGEGK